MAFSIAEIRHGAVAWETGTHPYLGGKTFASRNMTLSELGHAAFSPLAHTAEPIGDTTWIGDVLDLSPEHHRIAERIYRLTPNSTLDPYQIKSHPELAYYARFISATQSSQDEQRMQQILNDQLQRVNNEQQPNRLGSQLRRWGSRVVNFINSHTSLPTVPHGQELQPSVRR